MNIFTYSNVAFEPWNWETCESGLGCSEQSVYQMTTRLAKRGYNITNYVPLPEDSSNEHSGVKWFHYNKADFSQPGLWVLYRCPEILKKFDHSRNDQEIWFFAQDWWYPTLTAELCGYIDKMITMCQCHGKFLVEKHPFLRGKIWITSNGCRRELLEEIELLHIERNPQRIMFASSPDRGLLNLLKIYRRAKEYLPDLELYATYGFNNIDKLIASGNKAMGKQKDQIFKLVEETGARFLGRLSQRELYHEWFKTSFNVYPTTFFETSYATGAESQAMGAIPIWSPVYAQYENQVAGVQIHGDPNDSLVQAKFAAELVRWASNPDLQESIRPQMMGKARELFDWERHVNQWVDWLNGGNMENEWQLTKYSNEWFNEWRSPNGH